MQRGVSLRCRQPAISSIFSCAQSTPIITLRLIVLLAAAAAAAAAAPREVRTVIIPISSSDPIHTKEARQAV